MSVAEPGLRERKRRATSRTIQQVALRLALEQGLHAVTVDEISRRAEISPRTFFNYFPTKEQALLGDDPVLPDGEAIEAFVANGSGDLLRDLGALLARSTEELVQEHALLPERHQVLKENPQLFTQRMASMKEFQAALASVVSRRLAGDPALGADEETRDRRARLVAHVALATVRHAWWEWSQQDGAAVAHDAGPTLGGALAASFEELGTLVSRTPA